ncbi:MAG TPA: tRNA pseudouridine(13) synthase TruD [Nitrososphaeraceae archaeon]|jgi:tRNA pseudouridine13 synthase|nr:tRNA pseudouridine(13) synthase TruD [Nitrososphaeraceae archaeon]
MASISQIDSRAGIECYCTSFAGTGGSIKQGSEGFMVSELVNESLDISLSYNENHRYPLYILEKRDIDSNHALFEIERELHMRFRVMGIKDAKAVTTQYAGMERVMRNPPAELKSRHTRLTLKGFTKHPLQKKFLAGNKFEIRIYNVRSSDLSGFVPHIRKVGNFYGLQRFGSERLVTHLIGREIVKRNFIQAVELLLCHTTEFDTQMSREIRNKCVDPSNYRQVLKMLPRGMDIERQVLSALVAGRDTIAALRAVPITIRRLFVQAYQAYIFNRCLSRAVMEGEDLLQPQTEDLCFEMEGPATFGRIIKYNPTSKTKLVPAIRMAGYTFQPGKGRFENITRAIMQEEEEVSAKDFYIKEMQELSHQGGFRQAPLWCTDFRYERDPLTVSFKLPKGSYATTLLREIIKPGDPIRSGF